MKLPNFHYEKKYWMAGFKVVAGADEVGRGCFAGPVVAAAVMFDPKLNYKDLLTSGNKKIIINDSKKLNAKQRQLSAYWIKKNALSYGIGSASVGEINKNGMSKATFSAFRRALLRAKNKRGVRINYLLIDAFYIPYIRGLPALRRIGKNRKKRYLYTKQTAIVKGDEKSVSIAAASIIAKVYRDKLMQNLAKHKAYKVYHWDTNKGYGTKEHRNAILKYGISRYHRRAFVDTFLTNRQK